MFENAREPLLCGSGSLVRGTPNLISISTLESRPGPHQLGRHQTPSCPSSMSKVENEMVDSSVMPGIRPTSVSLLSS